MKDRKIVITNHEFEDNAHRSPITDYPSTGSAFVGDSKKVA